MISCLQKEDISMGYSYTQRLAQILRWLVTAVLAVNILILPLMPGYILLFQQITGTDAFSLTPCWGHGAPCCPMRCPLGRFCSSILSS